MELNYKEVLEDFIENYQEHTDDEIKNGLKHTLKIVESLQAKNDELLYLLENANHTNSIMIEDINKYKELVNEIDTLKIKWRNYIDNEVKPLENEYNSLLEDIEKMKAEINASMESSVGSYGKNTSYEDRPMQKLARNKGRRQALDIIEKYTGSYKKS